MLLNVDAQLARPGQHQSHCLVEEECHAALTALGHLGHELQCHARFAGSRGPQNQGGGPTVQASAEEAVQLRDAARDRFAFEFRVVFRGDQPRENPQSAGHNVVIVIALAEFHAPHFQHADPAARRPVIRRELFHLHHAMGQAQHVWVAPNFVVLHLVVQEQHGALVLGEFLFQIAATAGGSGAMSRPSGGIPKANQTPPGPVSPGPPGPGASGSPCPIPPPKDERRWFEPPDATRNRSRITPGAEFPPDSNRGNAQLFPVRPGFRRA